MIRRSNLGALIGSAGLSNLADGIFQITLPLLALSITRDPASFASVLVVSRLPWLLFALPAGALADRLDRRRTMLMVNVSRAIALAALAALIGTGSASLLPIYVAALALGLAETLFDTAAQSILPAIVDDPERLATANGRLQATELIANQFIGPPLGALIAGAAITAALFTSSVTYLVAAIALATVTGQYRPHRTGPSTRLHTDVAEGLRYLLNHRLLRVLGLCVGLSNLASTAMIAVFPLYAIAPGPVGLSTTGYGLLLVTIATGQVVGTTLTPHLAGRLGTRNTMLVATASFPIFSLVPALTSDVGWLAGGFFVAGLLSISWNILTVTLRQRIVPDNLLGRVNAGYRLVAWGTIPLGAALGGLVADRFGLTTTFWTAAGVSALCFPLIALGTNRHDLNPDNHNLDHHNLASHNLARTPARVVQTSTSTTGILGRVQWIDEVVELQEFFQSYYLGEEDSLARAELVFHPDFTFAGPDGDSADRDATLQMIRQGHGHTSSLTITTADHQLLYTTDELIVASYTEHHQLAAGDNKRLTTVVFVVDQAAPNGVLWLRTHESWIGRTSAQG